MKWWLSIVACCAFGGSLEGDSIARILEKQFQSFMLYDVEGRQVVVEAGMDAPVAVASLMKPFVALAYTGTAFPVVHCDGAQCWKPGGHGRVDLERAIGFSCNQYFLHVAGKVDAEQLRVLMRGYGVEAPLLPSSEDRIGLGTAAVASPKQLVAAYAEIFHRGRELPVWPGLLLAGKSGTAHHFHGKALAKTGTAACSNDEGDGLVIIGFPVQRVRWVVLVREHRVPGATVSAHLAKALGL